LSSDATQRFLGFQEALEHLIAVTEVDEEGRELMREYVALFDDLIETDGR
jgi:hypothetical protein